MTILVQRDFSVRAQDFAEFERQSREGVWPTFLRFGAIMAAFARWQFGDHAGPVATHTMYVDFDHWSATRRNGAYYRDEAMLSETGELLPVFAGRNQLIEATRARVIELVMTDGPLPVRRRAGEPLPAIPPTFGRGSVLAERADSVSAADLDRYLKAHQEQVWPWLREHGARIVAFGHDLSQPDTLVTLAAFPTLDDWRVARPETAPRAVADAWATCRSVVREATGRTGLIASDFGVNG